MLGLHVLTLLVTCNEAWGVLISKSELLALREETKEMFLHTFDSYMNNAFPADELMPLSCKGRYRDKTGLGRGDIDDVLGNYSLTLVDSLDTLVIMNELDAFETGVNLTIEHVHFDRDVIVSVFEANIRMLGGLLSAHVLSEKLQEAPHNRMRWYKGELLRKAKQLGLALLPAFDSSTGLPYPLVNLRHGVEGRAKNIHSTCVACAGTLILEFAVLSRLTGDTRFEEKVKDSMDYLWGKRNLASTLVGTIIDVKTGEWVERHSGLGAGVDSYYEYVLKAYILLGDEEYLFRFEKHYDALKKYIHNGTKYACVQMDHPNTLAKPYIDALVAFFPALQVLYGDLDGARESHQLLHHVHRKYKFLPEAFTLSPELKLYWYQSFLRPEFIESTYMLYRATNDPHYLKVGIELLRNLKRHARVDCGFAVFKDVRGFHLEDRLDSYFLAETLKYLYLLFSQANELPVKIDDYVFTTEAHLLPLKIQRLNSSGKKAGNKKRLHRSKLAIPKRVLVNSCERNEWKLENMWNLDALQKSWRSNALEENLNYCSQGSDDDESGKFDDEDESLGQFGGASRRIKANLLDLTNQEHIALLTKMGISIMRSPNEGIQLLFNPIHAKSLRDVAEGQVLMNELVSMIEKKSKYEGRDESVTVRLLAFKKNIDVRLEAKPAHFGPIVESFQPVAGVMKIAEPIQACNTLVGNFTDKIVLVVRGGCMFIEKARFVESSGARGLIVMDNIDDTSAQTSPPFAMSGDDGDDVHIPAVFLYGVEAQVVRSLFYEHGADVKAVLS